MIYMERGTIEVFLEGYNKGVAPGIVSKPPPPTVTRAVNFKLGL